MSDIDCQNLGKPMSCQQSSVFQPTCNETTCNVPFMSRFCHLISRKSIGSFQRLDDCILSSHVMPNPRWRNTLMYHIYKKFKQCWNFQILEHSLEIICNVHTIHVYISIGWFPFLADIYFPTHQHCDHSVWSHNFCKHWRCYIWGSEVTTKINTFDTPNVSFLASACFPTHCQTIYSIKNGCHHSVERLPGGSIHLNIRVWNGMVMKGSLARYIKLRVAHVPGMPGTFSPWPKIKGTAI